MCTSITFKTNDGSIIHGRTDEFGIFYNNDISLFGRNYEIGNSVTGKKTVKEKGKYGFFATNVGTIFGDDVNYPDLINDGLNEAGLSMGALYYAEQAQYTFVDEVKDDEIEFGAIGLNAMALHASVSEVVDYINQYQGKIVVRNAAPMPGHYFFIDRSGKSVVIEPDEPGYVTIYDKTNGIMTNSPNYSYHLLNLQSYANIGQIDGYRRSALKDVDGNPIVAHGTAGAFGLPGDTSPNSRFIRASYLRDTTTRKDLNTAADGILRMFRILNIFDIVPGMSLKDISTGNGEGGISPYSNPVDYENVTSGNTDHTNVKDLMNGIFYYKTYNNQAPRFVQFKDYDLDTVGYKTIKMTDDQTIMYQHVKL